MITNYIKRDEGTRYWGRLHEEGLHDLHSPNILWMTKSRRLKWAEHVARMVERRGAYRDLVGKLEGRNHLEDLDIDGRIIFKWIKYRYGVGVDWINLIDRWRTLVTAVMNLRALLKAGNWIS
jgi:hypothetical protein